MITLNFNKIVLVSFVLCLSLIHTSTASELTHKFGNPAFSKEGYSQHALSIEQLQYTKDKVPAGSNNFKFSFNHPVKELVWIMKHPTRNQTNYS